MSLFWMAATGQLARRAGGRHGPSVNKRNINLHVLNAGGQHGRVGHDTSGIACMHPIVDLWSARDTGDVEWTDGVLRQAAQAARATVLHGSFHSFTPNGGISGVLALAEGHITIHTRSERSFAAVDALMCGGCDPHDVIPVLQASFQPKRVQVTRLGRGRL